MSLPLKCLINRASGNVLIELLCASKLNGSIEAGTIQGAGTENRQATRGRGDRLCRHMYLAKKKQLQGASAALSFGFWFISAKRKVVSDGITVIFLCRDDLCFKINALGRDTLAGRRTHMVCQLTWRRREICPASVESTHTFKHMKV